MSTYPDRWWGRFVYSQPYRYTWRNQWCWYTLQSGGISTEHTHRHLETQSSYFWYSFRYTGIEKEIMFQDRYKMMAISVMHCEKLNPTTTSTWSSKQLPSLPKQFRPFAHRPGCSGYPLYPALHLQPNDPYLLMQTAFESQSSKSILHSSRSYQWKNHVDFIKSHIMEITNETISFFKEIPILHQNQSFF